MGKLVGDMILDPALVALKGSVKMTICSQQPTTFTEANSTFVLADVIDTIRNRLAQPQLREVVGEDFGGLPVRPPGAAGLVEDDVAARILAGDGQRIDAGVDHPDVGAARLGLHQRQRVRRRHARSAGWMPGPAIAQSGAGGTPMTTNEPTIRSDDSLKTDAPAGANAAATEGRTEGAGTSRPLPDDALILVPVRNVVLFPGMVLPLTVNPLAPLLNVMPLNTVFAAMLLLGVRRVEPSKNRASVPTGATPPTQLPQPMLLSRGPGIAPPSSRCGP